MEIDPRTIGEVGGGALFVSIILYGLTHPEKVQIWSAMLARAGSHLGRLFRGAHKHYVKHELQGRLNQFTKRVSRQAPYLEATKCRIKWETGQLDRKAFLAEDQVVIRLRRNDPDDMNFVHGAYHFVSTALLHKAKRYISPSHRESIDLFVTTGILEKEKAALVGVFLDEYLHPATADKNSKVTRYYDQYSQMDRMGVFYSVLLQELEFLGDKVFGQRRDDAVIIEVNDLIDHLEKFALRRVGEEMDDLVSQEYCKCSLMIVGKSFNVAEGARVYVNYVREKVVPRGVDTLYVLGPPSNERVMKELTEAFSDTFELFRRHSYKGEIYSPEGEPTEVRQLLYVLRRRGVRVFQPSQRTESTSQGTSG
jgi:hypothetical protein